MPSPKSSPAKKALNERRKTSFFRRSKRAKMLKPRRRSRGLYK